MALSVEDYDMLQARLKALEAQQKTTNALLTRIVDWLVVRR